jgi:diaminohydroxyphosphoribosylaminopyrimidine deaminase/5-amino-6-(5-phosphoribosylamino)uracil reductase
MAEGRSCSDVRLFGDASSVSDPHLARALVLAERGRGMTSPNPVVGCVIVRDGSVVGEGWHERAGGPHAEVVALEAAGDDVRGATVYVTLEPCDHTGRTGPCSQALLRAGVARVVCGMADPSPLAAGGAATLRAGGVDVVFAEDPRPYQELNESWLHLATTGRPFVRVKTAVTLDGHPSLADGYRSQLTGQEARALTMRLRAHADAVMVGAGTVAIDDPALTVRDEVGTPAERQPLRVVLARTAQPPAASRMFHDGAGAVVVLVPDHVSPDAALSANGARLVTFDIAAGIPGALRALVALGVSEVLVEAGPRLLTALVESRALDELVIYHAGGFGGTVAPPLYVGESQEDPLTLTRVLRCIEAGCAGGDAVTVWRPREERQDAD